MPVRKIKKNYRNVTGIFASTKAVGEAPFESTLERDFLTLLEFSPEVVQFEVQPVKIEWRDSQGKPRHYTPDVLVEFKAEIGRAPWLCEVKYRADLKKDWDTLHPKFLQAIRYARENEWRFRLMTEVEIRVPTLKAARFLLPFRRQILSPDRSEQLLAVLKGLKETTPNDLIRCLTSDSTAQALWIPAIWHLIAHFKIGSDLQADISMSSRIWSLQ